MKLRLRQDRNIGLLLLAVCPILIGMQTCLPTGSLLPLLSVLAMAAGMFILLGS